MTSLSSSVRPGTPMAFRSLMAGFPTGVSVITALDEHDRPWGMTCSALCSVTVEPPTLAVGMRGESPTLAAALHRGRFTVNLLHAEARGSAELFASGDPDRFDAVDWSLPEGAGGPHLTRAAHAVADCRIVHSVRIGGQHMVFGEVFRITELTEPRPLLYGLRTYGSWPVD
ncbi:flavin reductase family protein [Streptomyces sp. 130]|uniref:flavin reductase family protein n=1 Tax=Streptomyces sp. 130 TaxID=2591006 RepID=UPI00117F352F|nr:flavin reductase family protein [Streptomyces sp. 130]TRV73033.1 flavin reductase family protein [Streptomyces sp. 130]